MLASNLSEPSFSNRDLTPSIILSVSTNILGDIFHETILMLENQEIRTTNDILQQSININCTRSIILLVDNIDGIIDV